MSFKSEEKNNTIRSFRILRLGSTSSILNSLDGMIMNIAIRNSTSNASLNRSFVVHHPVNAYQVPPWRDGLISFCGAQRESSIRHSTIPQVLQTAFPWTNRWKEI